MRNAHPFDRLFGWRLRPALHDPPNGDKDDWMFVSVIIPTYNGEKYLAQTLRSVQAQTVTDWELVVVDDGSSDDTPLLVQHFADEDARIRLVRQSNGGIAQARNTGANSADPSSSYLCFLDHDDFWKPDALRFLLEAVHSNPSCVGAHGLMCVINQEGEDMPDSELELCYRRRMKLVGTREIARLPDQPTTFAEEAYHHVIYTVGQALIRKSIFHQIEGFDPETVPCDDFDFWLRLTLHGDLAFTDHVIVAWRQHGTNTSNHKDRMVTAEVLVRNKIASTPHLTHAQRQFVSQCLFGKQHLEEYRRRHQWGRDYLRQGRVFHALLQFRHAYHSYLTLRHVGSREQPHRLAARIITD